jgi:hypothetical protein
MRSLGKFPDPFIAAIAGRPGRPRPSEQDGTYVQLTAEAIRG